ncbi:hypothetical protein BT63DRAFT_421593 [Microthyrium microscopicum]|uniref:Uncharacterized protein n=1 Tax=Microthyrium microscopicum TaxID=703497 RepID=A0A6A6UMD9_9PEZI|nr:hypothetical protein BT63DRAFT_421593 [Microthyrium microscopicum]
MGQTLAIMYGEATSLSWWSSAMQGQKLDRLHFQWEVGVSPLKMLHRLRFQGWFSIAGIAFMTFVGLEALIQTASSTTSVILSYQAQFNTTIPNAFPAGLSGILASEHHGTLDTAYFTPTFLQVLQNYTAQSPIAMEVDGCSSTASESCGFNVQGLGFQYDCTASRLTTQPSNGTSRNTLFEVYFDLEAATRERGTVPASGGWKINLNTAWKDSINSSGSVLTVRNCSLTPALVEYSVNVTAQKVILQPPRSAVNWTSNSTADQTSTLLTDKVTKLLPLLEYDQNTTNFGAEFEFGLGTYSTMGGIALAFQSIFGSSVSAKQDPTNPKGAILTVQGAFVAPYAQFPAGTDNEKVFTNTFASPMDQLMSNIRDMMFRTSMVVAQNNVTDWIWRNDTVDSAETRLNAVPTNNRPVSNITAPGRIQRTQIVYTTDKTVLGAGIGLMFLALLLMLPLYWGYWRLGREVSMSPLEIAKALHYSTIKDPETDALVPYSLLDVKEQPDQPRQYASNLSGHELVKFLGKVDVRYGEVSPNVLGIGLSDFTSAARRDEKYI